MCACVCVRVRGVCVCVYVCCACAYCAGFRVMLSAYQVACILACRSADQQHQTPEKALDDEPARSISHRHAHATSNTSAYHCSKLRHKPRVLFRFVSFHIALFNLSTRSSSWHNSKATTVITHYTRLSQTRIPA